MSSHPLLDFALNGNMLSAEIAGANCIGKAELILQRDGIVKKSNFAYMSLHDRVQTQYKSGIMDLWHYPWVSQRMLRLGLTQTHRHHMT